MSNPNRLTTNKNTLSKKIFAAVGGLGLVGAGFLAGDRMHSEAPVSQNNDPAPTEVSTLAPTPEETLEKAGIRIADNTPTPNVEETLPVAETPTPIVFTGSEEIDIAPSPTASMTPIVLGNTQDSPKIEFTGEGAAPTSVVEQESGAVNDGLIVSNVEQAEPVITMEDQSPTIAPVTITELTKVVLDDTSEAVTPIEPDTIAGQEIIEPEGDEVENASESAIETINVQVQPGESVSQVLTEILGQAGYAIAPEQVDAIARELMAGAANGSGDVFDGTIVLTYDAESDTYKVAYAGEASLTPHAAEVIENELPTDQP